MGERRRCRNYGDFAAGSGVDVVERGGNVGNFATRHVRELNCERVTDRRLGRHLGFFAALRAAVRSRHGALSIFPASVPGGAGLRRLGSFRCRNGSLAPREQGIASFTRDASYRRGRAPLTPLACIRWWRVGPLRVAAWAAWDRATKVPQLGLPQAGRMC